jgi:cytochrome c5
MMSLTEHTAEIGVVMIVVGFAAMFLMYHLWKYPFDKNRRLSAAPKWAMYLHRILGYVFVAIYIALMVHMVPRLWEYQVEFPARTTIHIVLGFLIGFMLIVKISIMRFFRHFEEWMPYLGTGIMAATVVLLGLSLPFVFQEKALAESAPGGSASSAESIARLKQLLPEAGFPDGTNIDELATARTVSDGRGVLLNKCVKCHDLKTILGRPRTPRGWWQTNLRMAEKPALFSPMTDRDLLAVTTYLVAITPDLQKSAKHKREVAMQRLEEMEEAMEEPVTPTTPTEPGEGSGRGAGSGSGSGSGSGAGTGTGSATVVVDHVLAKKTYEQVCSQCHELSDVDAAPPTSRRDAERLVRRMITENDAEIPSRKIKLIVFWLDEHFVKKTR